MFIVENRHIKSRNEAELLGIAIYHRLAFTKHINNFYNTTSKTFENLTRIKRFLSQEQTKRLSEA